MATIKLQNVLSSVLPCDLAASGNVELLEFNTTEEGFEKIDQNACLKYHEVLMAVGREFNFALPSMSVLMKTFQDLDRCLDYRLTHSFKAQSGRNTFYRYEAEKLRLLTSYAIRLCRRSEVSRSPNMNILRELHREVSGKTPSTSSTTTSLGHAVHEDLVPLPDYPEDDSDPIETLVPLPDYPEESDFEHDLQCQGRGHDVIEIPSSAEVPADNAFANSEKEHVPIDYERQGKKKREDQRKRAKVLKKSAALKRPAASREEVSADRTSGYRMKLCCERGYQFYQIRSSAGAVMQVTSKQCFGRIEVAKEVAELLLRLLVVGKDPAAVKTFREALLFQGRGEICGHTFTLEGLASGMK